MLDRFFSKKNTTQPHNNKIHNEIMPKGFCINLCFFVFVRRFLCPLTEFNEFELPSVDSNLNPSLKGVTGYLR